MEEGSFKEPRSADDALRLLVEEIPDADRTRQLMDGLNSNGRKYIDIDERRPAGAFLVDGDRVIEGADGHTQWSWLYVGHLWVDESFRRRGLGRRVMNGLERTSRERGCRAAWLNTFSFEALDFYLRLGYQSFGDLRDFPPGHSRHYLWKDLRSSLTTTD